jgi:mannosyl-oligosaccharide glucosidase
MHDGRNFGTQKIKDSLNNIVITTTFVKSENGLNGGDWTVRVQGEPLNVDLPCRISVLLYAGLNGAGGLNLKYREKDHVRFDGHTPLLGKFSILGNVLKGTSPDLPMGFTTLDNINTASYRIASNNVWKAKNILEQLLLDNIKKYRNSGIPNPILYKIEENQNLDSNLIFFQHMVQGSFEIEYSFISGDADNTEKYFGKHLTEKINGAKDNFEKKFNSSFKLPKKGFSADQISFAKMLIGNMVLLNLIIS